MASAKEQTDVGDRRFPHWTARIGAKLGWIDRKMQTWKFPIAVSAVLTTFVLIINLTITIWAAKRYGISPKNGRRFIYEGNCETVRRWNTALHIFVNLLSTILLGASNYCMQCLSAPTRNEVDRAHASGRWLDIGALSIRNLRGIAPWRVMLWGILAATSLPIHLFYNSIVFPSLMRVSSRSIVVTSSFIDSNPSSSFLTTLEVWKMYDHNLSADMNHLGDTARSCDAEAIRLRALLASGVAERLENQECIDTYMKNYPTRGNALLVIQNDTSAVFGIALNDGWVCGPNFSVPCELVKLPNPSEFEIETIIDPRMKVGYCISEKLPEGCKLETSLEIAVIVIILTFVKASAMIAIVIWYQDEPLLTISDALCSFLEQRDPYSADRCLLSKDDLESEPLSHYGSSTIHREDCRRLYMIPSPWKWVVSVVLFLAIIAMAGKLLSTSIANLKGVRLTSGWIWSLGIGKPTAHTRLILQLTKSSNYGALIRVLVTNSVQPVLSVIYVTYNGLITNMSCAREWDSYSRHRKGLRVSSAQRGAQRSAYFLEVPYRFSLPLLISSAFLHWLASQSLFLSVEDHYQYGYADKWNTKISPWDWIPSIEYPYQCNYSPLAIILAMVTGGVMIICLLAVACIPLKTRMPIAGNCSAAIAAACHLPPGEKGEETVLLKVQWGVTGYDSDGVGHCAFSASPVTPPVEGRKYR